MEVSYIGPTGRELRLLTKGADWNRALAYAGISGLVGAAEAVGVEAILTSGQRPVGYRIKPMTGELTLHVTDDGTVPLGELESELRREFRSTREGTLLVRRRGGERYRTKVRLNGHIDPPRDAHDSGYAEVRIPLIADSGVWDAPEMRIDVASKKTITLSNPGDTYVYPRLIWTRSMVVQVADINVNVAATKPWQSVSLDPAQGLEVIGADGKKALSPSPDMALLSGRGMAPGGQMELRMAYGTAAWTVQYLDPWR